MFSSARSGMRAGAERSRSARAGAGRSGPSAIVALIALLVCLALAACGDDDGAKKTPDPTAVRETFASLSGTTANLVVAVGPGTRVRAYACDGDSTALWWTGDSANGAFKATSTDGGATLDAKVGDTVVGSVTFKDGKKVDFTAKAATGAQGLYAVELPADGKMTGSSLSGNAFSGQFDFKGNTLSGEVRASGKTVKISASQAKTGGTTAPGSYLAVLDAEGEAKGFQLKTKDKPADGFVSGWVMP
jgi:hypothetical protein